MDFENKLLGIRNALLVGQNSLYVNIPHHWVQHAKIKKGDYLQVWYDEKTDSLIIKKN